MFSISFQFSIFPQLCETLQFSISSFKIEGTESKTDLVVVVVVVVVVVAVVVLINI
jgi:hypothetical protein